MSFMHAERVTFERFMPKLDEALASLPLLEMERPGNPAIPLYRHARGPGLLIPKSYGGLGATPIEGVRIQRALSCRAPSLSVAVTMHHLSVATMVAYSVFGAEGREVLKQICAENLYVASGFAEGRSGESILAASMEAKPCPGGYRVTGQKKPCSLSRSMDLLVASVQVRRGDAGESRRGFALIPATFEGIERAPFWDAGVLGGAESDALILRDVFVPEALVFFGDETRVWDPVELAGFLWFELLIAASYLGMASALVERVLASDKGGSADRLRLAIELEGAMSALEGAAAAMMAGEPDESLLARTLLARYAVQGAIERAVNLAAELLGGIAFIRSPEIAYLATASRALAYHPPSRTGATLPLLDYLGGRPLGAL
jgi:alkylation response protein AidB-like acyl-CoA dehydrogenase